MKLRAIALASCLSLPIAAHAQSVAGPYVSLGLGANYATGLTNRDQAYVPSIDFFAPNSDHYDNKLNTRPSYAGQVGFGYAFGNGFRVDLTGDYLRNTFRNNNYFEEYYNDKGQERAYGGLNTYGVMLNGYYDFALGLPVIPYVGAGAGYQFVQLSSHLRQYGTGFDTAGTRGSFAYDVIAGLAYPVSFMPGLSATAEYRFSQLVESRNYINSNGVFDRFGQQENHTVTLGLRYQFGAPVIAAAAAPAPMSAPAPASSKTYLVFFDWDKYSLTPRATAIIAEAASDATTQKVTTLNVSGYTDTSGTPTYNQSLSERRAKAVAAKLVADGVPASEIEIHAYGETHLLVPTGPGVREPQNRRVEIVSN
jgi:outer membrane protein OmpA-like peptidoglycan-associated protein